MYSNLSGNLLKNFFTLYFLITAIQKFKMCMFFTNHSPDLCVLTLCIMFRKNNLHLALLLRISANSNENYKRYNFQALANISGKFCKISGNIKFSENSQP